MSYENFDPNDLLIQAYSTKPEGNFGPHRIPHGVRAIHLPTGTVVICDADRSQHKNRHNALTQLWGQVHGKPTYQELAAQVEALQSRISTAERVEEIFSKAPELSFEECKKLFPEEIRELQAEAGRDGFIAGSIEETLNSTGGNPVSDTYLEHINSLANQYADSIRRGEAQ